MRHLKHHKVLGFPGEMKHDYFEAIPIKCVFWSSDNRKLVCPGFCYYFTELFQCKPPKKCWGDITEHYKHDLW